MSREGNAALVAFGLDGGYGWLTFFGFGALLAWSLVGAMVTSSVAYFLVGRGVFRRTIVKGEDGADIL